MTYLQRSLLKPKILKLPRNIQALSLRLFLLRGSIPINLADTTDVQHSWSWWLLIVLFKWTPLTLGRHPSDWNQFFLHWLSWFQFSEASESTNTHNLENIFVSQHILRDHQVLSWSFLNLKNYDEENSEPLTDSEIHPWVWAEAGFPYSERIMRLKISAGQSQCPINDAEANMVSIVKTPPHCGLRDGIKYMTIHALTHYLILTPFWEINGRKGKGVFFVCVCVFRMCECIWLYICCTFIYVNEVCVHGMHVEVRGQALVSCLPSNSFEVLLSVVYTRLVILKASSCFIIYLPSPSRRARIAEVHGFFCLVGSGTQTFPASTFAMWSISPADTFTIFL